MNQSKQSFSLLPKIISVFRQGYTLKTFFKDLNAGIIVGIVALPLAIAFAIASGVDPVRGLYTAIVAGFLISLLGGSRFQIGGPTGAFVVVIFGIVHRFGYDGLIIASIIAGLILIVIGLLRVGSFIKFIPYPVTIGFTSGIALIIAISQIKDLFGLDIKDMPPEFVEKIVAYITHIGSINPWAAGIGAGSLLIMIVWPKIFPKVPASLMVILLSTIIVSVFNLPVETIVSRFGEVPSSLPKFHIPVISWKTIQQLFSPAITIALLAGIESLLSAVVADGMTGRRHRSNAEIIAQGVANIGSVCFGGIPVTGAIARTATNIKTGGQTPISGIIHAITLLLIMLVFGKWAGLIPLPALAAILLMVAYQMSEWRVFIGLFRYPKSDILVLLITFLLTVLIDLTVAIQVGMILAMFLLMHRMSEVTHAGYITNALREEEDSEDKHALSERKVPAQVEVFEINGIFFFGAIEAFKSAIERIQKKPEIFILRMRRVLSIDAAGLKAIEELYEKLKRQNTRLILSGVHAQPLHAMIVSGFYKRIGRQNVAANIDLALKRADRMLQEVKRA